MITTKLHPAFNTPLDNDVDGIQIDHKKLLEDLVHSNVPLIEIAGNHKLNLAQLIAWAAQPPVRALLDAADELAHRIAAHKAAQGAPAAIQTLLGQAIGLCETIREQEIASRAARTVLRFHAPRKPRNRKRIHDRRGDRKSEAAALQAAAGQTPPQSDSSDLDPPQSPRLRVPASPSLRFPVFPFRPQPSFPTTSLNPACPISPMGPMSPIRPIPSDPEERAHSNGHHPPAQPP